MPSPEQIAEIALNYGLVPIPLKGKKPVLPNWQKITAETALRKVKEAVNKRMADNIGILTGAPSGVVVVDVDVNRGGLDFWQELLQEHQLPVTFTVKTGSGGRHYYFLYDDRTAQLRNATRAIKQQGIDLKTTGGQVVFPGSVHPDTGKPYEIISGYDSEKDVMYLAEMPDWLFELLQANQQELNQRYPKKYLE